MNDQTGQLYHFDNMRELIEKKREIDARGESVTILEQAPNDRCPCCRGSGSVQVKFPWYDESRKIHRYIPCFCTYKKREGE